MTSPLLDTTHAFTTRFGGVSEGIFESLNLGENRGDNPESVRENYRRVCQALGLDASRLVFSKQVHGDAVRTVSSDDAHELFTPVPYEADGLLTNEKGLALVIFTADCVPVLFHDPVCGIIAASHAGWRGTASDIVGKTILAMSREYGCEPENIRAAIGPSIGKCCFETDSDVPGAMRAVLGEKAEKFIFPRGEKFTVDLRGINRALLMRAGLKRENIADAGECTMCRHKKYWSHRYTGGERGSMASIIML